MAGRRDIRSILDRVRLGKSDPDRWGKAESYGGAHWDDRSAQAARLVPEGARVLEIGVGKGMFRAAVAGRCRYLGADLNPLDAETLRLDLETDPLPEGPFDLIVLMGVLEYIHRFDEVAARLRGSGAALLISYCAIPGERVTPEVVSARRERGWVNDLSVAGFRAVFDRAPLRLAVEEPYKQPGPFWDQRIYRFDRA